MSVTSERDSFGANVTASGAAGADPALALRVPALSAAVAIGKLGPVTTLRCAAEAAGADVLAAGTSAGCAVETVPSQLAAAQTLAAWLATGDPVASGADVVTLFSARDSGVRVALALDLTAPLRNQRNEQQEDQEQHNETWWPYVEVIGGRASEDGALVGEVNLPCVIPELCPRVLTDLAGSPYTSVFELLGSLPVGWLRERGLVSRRLVVHTPALDVEVDSFGQPLLGASLDALELVVELAQEQHRPDASWLSAPVRVVVRSLQGLADVTRDVLQSVHPVSLRAVASGGDGSLLLSRALRLARVERFIAPSSPDGRPVLVPKEQQWWFPLSSVNAWRLGESSANRAAFSVRMLLKNPLGVYLRLLDVGGNVWLLRSARRGAEGDNHDPQQQHDHDHDHGNVQLERLWFARFALEEGREVLVAPNATSVLHSALQLEGNVTGGPARLLCSGRSVADAEAALSANCAVSTLLEQLIAQSETRVLVQGELRGVAAERRPRGWRDEWPARVRANFGAVFQEGLRGGKVRPFVPAPRYDLELPSPARVSAVDEFVSVFQTVEVQGWSSAWETLLSQGVTLAIQVKLHNPFAFAFEVGPYHLDVSYDDPTGVNLWYLPGFPPQQAVPAVQDLASGALDLRLSPDVYLSTPTQSVPLLDHKVENAARLYNAAEKVGALCGNVPLGRFQLGMGKFRWSQSFGLFNVSLVGANACLAQPWCVADSEPALDFEPSSPQHWLTVGSASKDSESALTASESESARASNTTAGLGSNSTSLVGSRSARALEGVVLRLTRGDSEAELGAAWLSSKVPVRDGLDVSFRFSLRQTARSGGGDGFAFVLQRDGGPGALGARCQNAPCNAYTGIPGPSFALVVYQSTAHYVELHGLIDGVSERRVGFGSSPALQQLADGKPHAMRVLYSRNERKVFVYVDGAWVASMSVWEPADADTGPCSNGSSKPAKNACIDMDAIAAHQGSAWLGFTASTGYLYTSEQRVMDVIVNRPRVEPRNIWLLEKGRAVFKPDYRFVLDLRDSCGGPVRRADAGLVVELEHQAGSQRLAARLVPGGDEQTGLLRYSFTPTLPGTYTVWVTRPGATPGNLGQVTVLAE